MASSNSVLFLMLLSARIVSRNEVRNTVIKGLCIYLLRKVTLYFSYYVIWFSPQTGSISLSKLAYNEDGSTKKQRLEVIEATNITRPTLTILIIARTFSYLPPQYFQNDNLKVPIYFPVNR